MMRSLPFFLRRATLAIFVAGLATSSAGSAVGAASSTWVVGHKAKARLIAGRTTPADGSKLMAFVEIALDPGWKTYWRSPGDAGLPPSLDWSKSVNLAAANVQFPAPRTFTDKSGTTIGYEGTLFLPVAVTAQEPGQPMELAVTVHYGICKDICVPIDAELKLDVPAGDDALAPAAALVALDRVPRAQANLLPGDPVFVRAEGLLEGEKPKILVEARFPGIASDAAVFLEAAGGQFLPIPAPASEGARGTILFDAELGPDVDLGALKGTTVTATLVGETGASSATFVLP